MCSSGSRRGGARCRGQRRNFLRSGRVPGCCWGGVSMIHGMSLAPVIMSQFVGSRIAPRPGRVREAAARLQPGLWRKTSSSRQAAGWRRVTLLWVPIRQASGGSRAPCRRHAVAAPAARGGRRHAVAAGTRWPPRRPALAFSRPAALPPSRPIVPRYAPGSCYGGSRAAAVAFRGLGCPRRAQGTVRPDPRGAPERRRRLDSSRSTNPARGLEKPRAARWSAVATRGSPVGRLQPMT